MLCLLASQVSRATSNDAAAIKAHIVENYLLWQEAFKARDAVRMISYESPDYTSVIEEGRVVGKSESDQMWRDVMADIKKVYSARAEIKKLTIEPNRVVVLSHQHVDALRRWHSNEPQRVIVAAAVRDTWVKYDGAWMLKRSEDLNSKVIVDGKVQKALHSEYRR